MTDEERVFVVPRSAVPDAASWYGLRTTELDGFVAGVERDGRFEPRPAMEQDPSYKQIIPYLVLRDGSRYSIGVGGHLNPGDGGLLGGLRREWDEELAAGFVPEFRLVALLNDDTTPVGAVHLGAVYVGEAAGRPVAIRETDKLAGAFAEPDEVRGVRDRLETWSALVFDFLEAAVGS